jgi:hypothetical protein
MRQTPEPSSPVPTDANAPAPIGRVDTPVHAIARMAMVLPDAGVRTSEAIPPEQVEASLAMLRASREELASDVRAVHVLETPTRLDPTDPSRPADDAAVSTGSWSIQWEGGHQTTVTMMIDGGSVTMGGNGVDVRPAADDDLRLVTVRHVSGVRKGIVTSLSATLDPTRLHLPVDAPDHHMPVHVARTVTTLLILALDDLGLRMERGRDHVAASPEDRPQDMRLILLTGVAAVLDAGREDLLDPGPDQRHAVVSYRPAGPLADARCSVRAPDGTSLTADPDIHLDPMPSILNIALMGNGTTRSPYLIATIAGSRVSVPIAPADPIERLRLMADARPFRRSATDHGDPRP